MAFTALTAAQTDSDSPIDQTLMDLIRTNFDDHETRIGALTAANESTVNDDFTATAISSKLANNGTGTHTEAIDAADHVWSGSLTSGLTGMSAIEAPVTTYDVLLDTDHYCFLEIRMKFLNLLDVSAFDFVLGFQDVAHVITSGNMASDITDFVGWADGTADDTVRFLSAKAGATDASSDFGDTTAWQVFRVEMEVTTGGTVFSMRGYLDGTLKHTVTSSANVPTTVHLRPVCGWHEHSGTSTNNLVGELDYFYCGFTSRSSTA